MCGAQTIFPQSIATLATLIVKKYPLSTIYKHKFKISLCTTH